MKRGKERKQEKYIIVTLELDLSKAFDRFPRHTVAYKLVELLPDQPYIVNLLANSLCNRGQSVQNDNQRSEMLLTNCGVPQGTVYGPIMINILYDELQIEENLGDRVEFADYLTCTIARQYQRCIFTT